MIGLAVALAAAAGFMVSAVLYGVPPVARLLARTSTPRPGIPSWVQLASVVLRGIVVAGLIAGLMLTAGWHGAAAGALLGVALAALPLALLAGAVVHEDTPLPTAAVHLLDWTLKLVLSGTIVGTFL